MIVVDRPENEAKLSTNISDVAAFKIKESAKAFRILSSSLYSNKIRAVVRELTCNARDSHVEAGNPEPYFVHLPTSFEPTFSVQDFGVGMSHAQVMDLYSTYFDSTKTGSNDFVGALGLGSKSPFSYTDNFVFVAIKDGEMNTYSAFINDVGVPSIARLGTEKTDKPNGVIVQMAVKSQDFTSFSRELQEVAKWYDMQPNTNLSTPIGRIRLKQFNPFSDDTGTNDFKTTVKVSPGHYGSSYNTKCTILMGGVPYPIDSTTAEFKKYEKGLLKEALIFEADIGAVDIQPSREGLTYSQKTIDYIVSQLNDLDVKIQAHMMARLDKETTLWGKVVFLSPLTTGLLGETARDIMGKIGGTRRLDLATLMPGQLRYFARTSRHKKLRGNAKGIVETPLQALAFSGTKFFYVDDSRYTLTDIAEGARDRGMMECYVFFPKKGEAFDPKKMSETMHGIPINKISDYFDRKQRAPVTRSRTKFYRLEEYKQPGRRYSSYVAYRLDTKDTVPATVKHYFLVEGNKVKSPGNGCAGINVDIGGAAKFLHRSGYAELSVGVSKAAEKIAKALGLTSVWDVIEKDVLEAKEIASTTMFDSITVFVAKKNAYCSQLINKPTHFPIERVSEIADPELRSLWMVEQDKFEENNLHWVYRKSYLNPRNIQNSKGERIDTLMDNIYRKIGKYNIINVNGLVDADATIKLINFVHSNF